MSIIQIQVDSKNIEQIEFSSHNKDLKALIKGEKNQEFVSWKNTFSIEKSVIMEDYVSHCYSMTFAGIVSLSLKLGFDRKIYLHIITEESGVFAEIPISRIY